MWLTGMVRVSDISTAREVVAKAFPGVRFS
jgi:hypothetical protein